MFNESFHLAFKTFSHFHFSLISSLSRDGNAMKKQSKANEEKEYTHHVKEKERVVYVSVKKLWISHSCKKPWVCRMENGCMHAMKEWMKKQKRN